jgi:tetratricopeptide (TPR) repeat protein
MTDRFTMAACLIAGFTQLTFAGEEAIPVESKKKPDPAASIQVDAATLYEQGRNSLFRGKYEDAIKSLKAAVEADEKQTSYQLYLARAYRYAKQPEQSEKLLTEILKLAPDHVEAGQLLAEVYYSREKWKAVTDTLEPLLKYRHDFPTYHMLAEAAYNQDDHENARKYYREAIKLNPDSGPDHYQLGNIYLAENRFALAARSYEKALQLGLDSVVLHYKLASAYFNLRNYFGRISVATVKAGEPGTISGNLYLIEQVPGKKDVFRVAPERSAVFHIERAIEGGLAERADTQMLLANVYLNARRYDRAYEMYEKLGDMVPEEDAALYAFYFAQSAFGVRKYDAYLEQLHAAVKLDPEAYGSALVDGYLQVADRYNQGGQLDKYIEHLAMAVNESPQTTSLHLKLGNAFEDARKYENAVQQWRLVLDLEPDHPERTRLLNLIRKHS